MNEQKMNAAKQQLTDWLSDPRELGGVPARLEYIKTITDQDGMECAICKFKKSVFSKWILGIASDIGAFSQMQEYNEATAEKNALECLAWLKNYGEYSVVKQDSENEDEYKEEIGHFMGFVLLSNKTWNKEQLRQDLREDWEIDPVYASDEDDEESDEDLHCDADVFEIGTSKVVLGFIDMPIPDGEAEHNAAFNYMWEDAVAVTKTHQAQIIVTIMGEHKDPIEDGELFVKVIASLCKQENVIGVYANGVVYQPKFYLAMKALLDEGLFPIYGLIWFGAIQTKNGFSVYTIGMNHFGKDDMEILDTNEDVNELRDFMINTASYCIEQDVTLRAGESIGVSADHRCQISRSEGVYVDGMTLKIAYREE